MKNNAIRVLAEIAIFAALGFALDALEGGIFKGVFPNGGSIGFAMIPVLIIAYRRGMGPGILCGLILSIVQMLGGVYVISGKSYDGALSVLAPIAQISLDYVLAYTVVGFAGAFAGMYKHGDNKTKIIAIIVGSVIGGLLKYTCHLLSGGLFWLDPSIEFLGVNGGSWVYTFWYNGLYMIPNIILCTIVMVIIALVYPAFLNPDAPKEIVNDVEKVEAVEEDSNSESKEESNE